MFIALQLIHKFAHGCKNNKENTDGAWPNNINTTAVRILKIATSSENGKNMKIKQLNQIISSIILYVNIRVALTYEVGGKEQDHDS